MNSTDATSPEAFYADYVLPLKRANERRGVHYFPRSRDADASSYWAPPATRTGGAERREAAACTADALLDSLASYWSSVGQAPLTRVLPGLRAVRQHLADAGDTGDSARPAVTDFVYPLH